LVAQENVKSKSIQYNKYRNKSFIIIIIIKVNNNNNNKNNNKIIVNLLNHSNIFGDISKCCTSSGEV